MTESKITARVDPMIYKKVKEHFHHGQQAQFFRKLFRSLEILTDNNQTKEITDYLYNNCTLTLPTDKED